MILQLVNEKGKISVAELSEKTNVSVVTIRHDLNMLEAENYLKREHGFAVLLDVDRVDDRMRLNFTAKQALAKAALTLVNAGDTLFVEGGSANAFFARELVKLSDITVITPNLYIAEILKNSHVDVLLLGGFVQSKSENLIGPITRDNIRNINFNKAFIGFDGFHADYGFTGRDMMRAEVINAVLEKQIETIMMSDSSKIGTIHPYSLKPIGAIKCLVTDKNITKLHRQQIEALGINIKM